MFDIWCLALSDAVIIQIGTAFIALTGTIASGIMAYLMAKLNYEYKVRSDRAEASTEDVKEKLARDSAVRTKKLDAITAVAKATHTLVNGNMTAQLNINRLLARRLAELPNAKHEDVQAAQIAEQLYQSHLHGLEAAEARTKVDEKTNANIEASHSSEPVS